MSMTWANHRSSYASDASDVLDFRVLRPKLVPRWSPPKKYAWSAHRPMTYTRSRGPWLRSPTLGTASLQAPTPPVRRDAACPVGGGLAHRSWPPPRSEFDSADAPEPVELLQLAEAATLDAPEIARIIPASGNLGISGQVDSTSRPNGDVMDRYRHRPGDINRTDWTWTVRRQTTTGPGGLVDKGTKGRRARTVPIIEEIRELVERRIAATDGTRDARLFVGPRGGRISTAVLRDATHWDEVVNLLGHEHLRRHDLRHTGLTCSRTRAYPSTTCNGSRDTGRSRPPSDTCTRTASRSPTPGRSCPCTYAGPRAAPKPTQASGAATQPEPISEPVRDRLP